MEKLSYPSHPVRCIINGPSECGKSVFLTKLVLNNFNENLKLYTYSPSLHQDLFQKILKCFGNFIPILIIRNILSEEDIDIVIDEVVKKKDFEKSDSEIETYESIEELKNPQKYEDGGFIILDDLNEKEMNDPRVQAMFKRSRDNNLSIFKISQDYYELPKRTIRANGNTYHIFKANNFRDVQYLYHDKPPKDMTLDEFNYLTSTCWTEQYQPVRIDMTKHKYAGRYRLRLNSVFVPKTSLF